ncbi:MAG: ABC transporter ATP-binding protein [Verrucomicrobiales bacterium]|jgi:ABC-type lipoprotein export system ATPase subunit|nr:ABC transporter ATP-binding protein [Verrucomicrobiales bacterium]
MNCLELSNLSKDFPFGHGRRVEVLKKVSLTVPDAGTVAISGSSGSGKTTLLNIIGGLTLPTDGEVRWRGASIYAAGRAGLARWRAASVGFIFQAWHLMPELSALENILLPAALQRRDRAALAWELLEQVGLTARAHHRPAELSGGEQQRAAIARALINDPAVILADEPTGNLDQDNREAVLNLLLDLAGERNKSVVLVTHDEAVARRMDLRYRLTGGRLEHTK